MVLSGRMGLHLCQPIHLPVDSIGWRQQRHQAIENGVSILGVGHVGGRHQTSVEATQAERMQSIHGVAAPVVDCLALDGQLGDPVGPDDALQLADAVDVVRRRRRRRLAEHHRVHVAEDGAQRGVVALRLRSSSTR